MEENSGVQAPVTRLRRRLSVEQSEDLNSPGPATPNKKRGGRLAAKPQLELIDENAGSTSKRSTKKAPVKEIAEASEEKPLTPSRRSTRIKSNTSIISDTAQSVDSPRAKRAARRTSQVGSDNETVVTPARTTRRTRKDSTSSVDKLDTTLVTKPNITEIIIEETEVNTQKSDNSSTKSDNVSPRKSPRLKEKKERKDNPRKSTDNTSEQTDSVNNDTINDLNILKQDDVSPSTENKSVIADTEITVPEISQDKSADASLDIIKELDKKTKSKPSIPNKSMSALDNDNNYKNKRQRSKSLNVISQSEVNDSAFISDNEKTKKKVKKENISTVLKVSEHRFASGDSKLTNISTDKYNRDPISNPTKTSNLSLNESHSVSDFLANTIDAKRNKENINAKDNVKHDSIINFLKNPSSLVLQTTVIYDDSDTDVKTKPVNKNIGSEDQCVPVVETRDGCENSVNIGNHILNKSDKKSTDAMVLNNVSALHNSERFTTNDSCEPMDVDVTIPKNVSVFSNTLETSHFNKSSECSNLKCEGNTNKSSNKSKRKSTVSLSASQNPENSGTENKSTLILSQIKDLSSSENNVSKSPKQYQEILSNSTNSDTTNNKMTDKKNLSLDYSTSTPLQQKHLKKLGLQINTSAIETAKNENNQIKQSTNSPNISKKDISKSEEMATPSDEESSTDDESSKTKSLLDNEVDVASDNYESGDSQDEEERQYQEDHEIVEKGETLDSEEDISNDSEYERDSFVVSSDDDDRDLLSGSGDDLSITDNELTMSAKSKKKYNDRKLKEQKNASKEMFDARHNIQNTKKSRKKIRNLESSDTSEDEIVAHGKKNKHQRLDSTHEDTDTSKVNETLNKKKKTKRLLSESDANESITKEPEITTVVDNSAIENDPLSTQVKQEPKTPLKDFNVSTVQINEAIEEVVVENNNSFSKSNQTTDPLHFTIMDNDDESSLSENSEIMNNYDSVLNQLNNNDTKSKTIKSHDMSLNPINKTKITKIPIVEELNLTNAKKSKRNKKIDTLEVVNSPKISKATGADMNQDITNNFNEDSSSDSIDLHLLFSEDSNETLTNKKEKGDDDFIPLKRTPAKTNILNQDEEQPIGDEFRFVIDTQGTRESTNNSLNLSLNNSTKKKNKKNKSLNTSQISCTNDNNSENEDAPLEMPYNSSKNENGKKFMNTSKENHEEIMQNNHAPVAEPSIPTRDSAKKSKKKRLSEYQEQEDAEKSVPKLESTKKTETLSESHADHTEPAETSLSIPGSSKKKKNLNSHIELTGEAETSLITPGSDKKKKNKSILGQADLKEANTSIVIPGSGKKKKRLSETELDKSGNIDKLNTSQKSTLDSAKKQRKEKIPINISSQKDSEDILTEVLSNSKKRKRKSSGSGENHLKTEDEDTDVPQIANKSLSAGRQNKKRKISQNDMNDINEDGVQKKILKKRKRDGDEENNASKKFKESSFDKQHVPRLPASILNQLEDKPKKEILDMKKLTVISTTPFAVEEAKKRKNKPSNFLEESVYLNESEHLEKNHKGYNIKKPQVLPFVPTATTSGSGFTTNFKINIIPQEVKFVAQTKNVTNFKTDYLYGKKIKRLGTYEMYKKHRTFKISKF